MVDGWWEMDAGFDAGLKGSGDNRTQMRLIAKLKDCKITELNE
jgi:hypothetical protein